jgi:hypothetical protein
MTEENTLPENGWAIRATKEEKKHPKWEIMLNSIGLLNMRVDNDVWVGRDDEGSTRNDNWPFNVPSPNIITMNNWCDMNNLSRTHPTIEEEINSLEPEFDPDKEIEVSVDGVIWQRGQYIYIGQNGYRKNHVVYDIEGYHEYEFVRNYKDFNAGMLGVGQHMIVKDPVALHLEDHLVRMTVDRRLFDMDADSLITGPDYMYLKGKRVNVKLEVTDV